MDFYISKNYISGGFSFTVKIGDKAFRSIAYKTKKETRKQLTIYLNKL